MTGTQDNDVDFAAVAADMDVRDAQQAPSQLAPGEPAPTSPAAAPQVPAGGPRTAVNPITGLEAPLPDKEPGLPKGPLDAIIGGAAQAVFETKDFLVGQPKKEDQSTFRQNVESGVKEMGDESTALGITAGMSQFAVGLLGAGKLIAGAKLIPSVAAGAEALGTAVAATGKAGQAAVATVNLSGKAAATGAVVFDPHQERLSNFIQGTFLANPVTRFLAADQNDSEALGRVKSALESIGVDRAVVSVFGASLWALKKFKSGDTAAAQTAQKELQAAVDEANAPKAAEGETQAASTGALEPDGSLRITGKPQPHDSGVEIEQTTKPDPAAQDIKSPISGGEDISDDQIKAVLAGSKEDIEALDASGGWSNAVADGHTFGKGGSIPWQLVKTSGAEGPETAMDTFVARVAETMKAELADMKGGSVITDARNDRMLKARINLWGDDPDALVGMLETAGKDAVDLRANLNASFVVASRMMQDTYAMAQKINLGFLEEWGGDRAAALKDFADMLGMTTRMHGAAQSQRANVGRAMRGMRQDTGAVTGAQLRAMQEMDPEMAARLMANTEGNPRAIAKVLTWGEKITDWAQWVQTNGLISGPITPFVNITSNLAVALWRPVERVLGSWSPALSGAESQRLRAVALREHMYMGASINESWRAAMQAWNQADSILNPHGSELAPGSSSRIGQAVAQAEFRPMDSPGNFLYNIALLTGKAIGAPGRINGFADEFFKQTIYRSRVLANAHVEGMAQGLAGADLEQFVRGKLFDSFDDMGRATDLKALQEAKTGTFQQDLLKGTMGANVQQLTNNFAPAKFILPFVKTPTNLIRMSWKMTPGLNLLQQEYREMIRGQHGPEAAAQAMGQMAMGTLITSAAGWYASQGLITGAGPTDHKVRDALQATGWRPYSKVTVNADGSRTYTPYNRFDPVGMVMGIAADITDVIQSDPVDGESKAAQMATGLGVALARNITNKTYLRNLQQALEGLSEPENKGAKTAGGIAAGFIPMSAMARYLNSDPYMRDARTFADRIMTNVPGLSSKLEAKRDAWGDPITMQKGLWVDGKAGIVDAETRRMAEDYELSPAPPSPNVEGGVDLRDIYMKDGTNAYTRYQELARQPSPGVKPIKDLVADLMHTPAYNRAPDGEAGLKGTKLYMVAGLMARYREHALKTLKADPGIRDAMLKKQRDVMAAIAASKPNPTNVNQGQQLLDNLGAAFGTERPHQ